MQDLIPILPIVAGLLVVLLIIVIGKPPQPPAGPTNRAVPKPHYAPHW